MRNSAHVKETRGRAMTDTSARRMHVTPGWSVADVPNARKAALGEWISLRVAEQTRAADRMTRDDAMSGPDTYAITDDPNVNGRADTRVVATTVRTVDAMADRASLTMPISGVHILPTFGRGEHVAPYLGDTRSVTEYATPQDADAWSYVATHAMGDGFSARVIHVMTSEAIDHGRPVDHAKRDDVASEARAIFVGMVTDWMTRDDVYSIRDESNSDALGSVTEWGIPRQCRCNACDGCVPPDTRCSVQCGACEACMRHARRQTSARRASRWSLAGCSAPVVTIDWVTPSRALSRAVWRAAADPTLSTSAVYATRAPYLRKLAGDVATDERMNAQRDVDVLRNVPDGAADLIRLITATLAITGDPVVTTRGLSPAARTVLTLVMGNSDTPKGERLALAKARKLWMRATPEAPSATDDARVSAAADTEARVTDGAADAMAEGYMMSAYASAENA